MPYKSSPQALTDLMGNQIQVYVADLGSAWGTIKTDRVRTLAVTAAKGSTLLPNVPAIGKTLPGFDITSWNGIFGPAGMPVEITERLNTELQAILRTRPCRSNWPRSASRSGPRPRLPSSPPM